LQNVLDDRCLVLFLLRGRHVSCIPVVQIADDT
jgi:hypothetical protein